MRGMDLARPAQEPPMRRSESGFGLMAGGRYLVAPQIAGIGKAVDRKDRRTAAADLNVKGYPAGKHDHYALRVAGLPRPAVVVRSG